MASPLSVCCFLILCCFMQQVVESATRLRKVKQKEIGFICSRRCKEVDNQQSDTGFPLYRCSCSPSCSIYGDCCFDSPYKDMTMWLKENFACFSVAYLGGYLVVFVCPSDKPSGYCKDGLGHLPPVTSSMTNVTYANKFCAECNDDNADLIKWNVELRCLDDVNTGEGTKYIYKSGIIWIVDKATGSKAYCSYHIQNGSSKLIKSFELRSCDRQASPKISLCSSSWNDASVSEKCRTYEDPVYFLNRGYRNVHCAICNYENRQFEKCYPSRFKSMVKMLMTDSEGQKFCKDLGYAGCMDFLGSTRKRGHEYLFSEIFPRLKTGCVPPKGRRCCSGESYDKRSKRCRKKNH